MVTACKMCDKARQTVYFYCQWLQHDGPPYKARHDKLAKVKHWDVCKKYGTQVQPKWFKTFPHGELTLDCRPETSIFSIWPVLDKMQDNNSGQLAKRQLKHQTARGPNRNLSNHGGRNRSNHSPTQLVRLASWLLAPTTRTQMILHHIA